MKKTFWSFFEEKAICSSECDDATAKAGTQTATFSREGLDQDQANNALSWKATSQLGSLTKTGNREESDQDIPANSPFLQNIPKTITGTREDSDAVLAQISQISFGKKKSTICTCPESTEEEHARCSNFFSQAPRTQTRAREESDQDASYINLHVRMK